MTPETLAHILRQTAGHLNYLQEELEDSGLPVARQSQTGVRSSTVNRSAPVDLTQLDYMQAAAVIIKGWCYNLASDTKACGLPMGQPLPVWAAWLRRYAHLILGAPWADDCVSELVDLESELRHHIHPTDPHQVKLPDYATIEEIGAAIGKKPETVRKWCNRHGVTSYVQEGKVHYRTRDITQ